METLNQEKKKCKELLERSDLRHFERSSIEAYLKSLEKGGKKHGSKRKN